MNQLELKRQDAVIDYMMPVPLLNLLISGGREETGACRRRSSWYGRAGGHRPLHLPGERQGGDRGLGRGANIEDRSGSRVAATDPAGDRPVGFFHRGAVLAAAVRGAGPGRGESRSRSVSSTRRQYTAEVYVHFAPPFMYRSPRDCDFFDPATFDPTAKLAEHRQRLPNRRRCRGREWRATTGVGAQPPDAVLPARVGGGVALPEPSEKLRDWSGRSGCTGATCS